MNKINFLGGKRGSVLFVGRCEVKFVIWLRFDVLDGLDFIYGKEVLGGFERLEK